MSRRRCCCGPGTPTAPCSPCNVPKGDLTASWTAGSGGIATSGSGTMVYSPTGSSAGADSWIFFPAPPATTGLHSAGVSLECRGGTLFACITELQSLDLGAGPVWVAVVVGCSNDCLNFNGDSTCSPLHLHWTVLSFLCPDLATFFAALFIDLP